MIKDDYGEDDAIYGPYHIVEYEDILNVCPQEYEPSPLAGLLILAMEKVMPIEYWALAPLIFGIVFGILKEVLK